MVAVASSRSGATGPYRTGPPVTIRSGRIGPVSEREYSNPLRLRGLVSGSDPVLTVLAVSDSFAALWAGLARERGLDLVVTSDLPLRVPAD